MATKRSNDMARSTEDSTTEKKWRKNIWTRQALKPMSDGQTEHSSVVGIAAKVRPTSVRASMDREVVHGLVQAGGLLTAKRIRQFRSEGTECTWRRRDGDPAMNGLRAWDKSSGKQKAGKKEMLAKDQEEHP